MMDAPRICITLDVDWAPDGTIAPVLAAMREARVKCTFFATHESLLLAAIDDPDVEVGLHPNFIGCNGDYDTPIRSLKTIYPRARGARSHALYVSSHILRRYKENGLSYESNNFMPMHQYLRPMLRFEEFVSIPFYWSDDRLEVYSWFDVDKLLLDEPGLKVLNFHPIHVFMNTAAEEHYLTWKQHYQDPDALRRHIHTGAGVGSLFEALLARIRQRDLPTYTMGSVCDEFLRGGS